MSLVSDNFTVRTDLGSFCPEKIKKTYWIAIENTSIHYSISSMPLFQYCTIPQRWYSTVHVVHNNDIICSSSAHGRLCLLLGLLFCVFLKLNFLKHKISEEKKKWRIKGPVDWFTQNMRNKGLLYQFFLQIFLLIYK